MNVDTITLTLTDRPAFGLPILVIDGEVYPPTAMTPAGVIAAELVQEVAAWFERYGHAETRLIDLQAILRDLWAGAMIGPGGDGFVKVSPDMTASVVAALR